MNISVALVYLVFSIPFGPGPVVADWGVYPSLGINTWGMFSTGGSTPIGYWYNEPNASPIIHMEELSHINQIEALGPLFPIAYLIQPRFFEPYNRDILAGSAELRCIVPHCMWSPPKEIERQFPQFRVTFNDEGVKWDFLPGYVPFLRSLTSWLN
jgi:hypothetical protein